VLTPSCFYYSYDDDAVIKRIVVARNFDFKTAYTQWLVSSILGWWWVQFCTGSVSHSG